MASAPTKPGTLKLSEVARHVVVPGGIATTGWPAVRDRCADIGIAFRWWQHAVGKIILAKRADGKYASTIGGTGLSIPRQVGKTFLVGAIMFALCLLFPNLTVIWTAHRLRTAEETFGKMQKFAKRAKIAPHILKIVLGSGEEAILFTNGSRILFGARESGFGLGFDEVDVLIFDEAQRLRDMTLDDMIPATNQSRQPAGALLLFMGTPPRPTDAGEVFTRMRTEALASEEGETAWVEFGADPGFKPTLKPHLLTDTDWKQIAKANPSYPDDTPREAILRMRKQLTDESLIREGFGIWDDDDDSPAEVRKVPLLSWALTERDVRPDGDPVFFVTIAKDMASASVAVAALHEGVPHVELADHRPGTGWLTGRLVELRDRYPDAEFKAWRSGPVKSWVPTLAEQNLELELLSAGEAIAACGHLERVVKNGPFTHSPDPVLTESLKGSVTRALDGGGWKWDWGHSPGDVAPIAGVTGALWALESTTVDSRMFLLS